MGSAEGVLEGCAEGSLVGCPLGRDSRKNIRVYKEKPRCVHTVCGTPVELTSIVRTPPRGSKMKLWISMS